MECKVETFVDISAPVVIGIYPEWNVKTGKYVFISELHIIGIYPEWNVKLIC